MEDLGTMADASMMQQEFPYSREDRFGILREALARLPESLTIERPGDRAITVRGGLAHALKALMETLIVYSSAGECRRSRRDLAVLARFPETTLRRQLAVAEALGWITIERPRGGRANVIRIEFAAMKSWRPPTAATVPSYGPHGTKAPELRSHGDQCSGPMGTNLRSHGDQSTICIPFIPPPPPREEPVGDADEWAAAAAALKDCGVGDRQPAIDAARGRGCAEAELLALCDHFRRYRGAWQPQFLRWRVMTHEPGDDPQTGWPPMSPEYRKRERERRAAAEQQAQREAEQAERDARTAAIDDEEEAVGILAALDECELDQLLQRAEGFERDWLARQRGDPRDTPVGRTILLRILTEADEGKDG